MNNVHGCGRELMPNFYIFGSFLLSCTCQFNCLKIIFLNEKLPFIRELQNLISLHLTLGKNYVNCANWGSRLCHLGVQCSNLVQFWEVLMIIYAVFTNFDFVTVF